MEATERERAHLDAGRTEILILLVYVKFFFFNTIFCGHMECSQMVNAREGWIATSGHRGVLYGLCFFHVFCWQTPLVNDCVGTKTMQVLPLTRVACRCYKRHHDSARKKHRDANHCLCLGFASEVTWPGTDNNACGKQRGW